MNVFGSDLTVRENYIVDRLADVVPKVRIVKDKAVVIIGVDKNTIDTTVYPGTTVDTIWYVCCFPNTCAANVDNHVDTKTY